MKELLKQQDTNTLNVLIKNEEKRKPCAIRYDILRNIKKHIMSLNDRRKHWKKPKRKRNIKNIKGKEKVDKRIFRLHLY